MQHLARQHTSTVHGNFCVWKHGWVRTLVMVVKLLMTRWILMCRISSASASASAVLLLWLCKHPDWPTIQEPSPALA